MVTFSEDSNEQFRNLPGVWESGIAVAWRTSVFHRIAKRDAKSAEVHVRKVFFFLRIEVLIQGKMFGHDRETYSADPSHPAAARPMFQQPLLR